MGGEKGVKEIGALVIRDRDCFTRIDHEREVGNAELTGDEDRLRS